MKPRMMMKGLSAAFLVAVLLSCGGGGGGGGDTPPTVIPLQTSSLRLLQQGDTWNYSVRGSGSNGLSTVQLSGTLQVQILNTSKTSPINSAACLDEYAFGNISGLIDPISTHVYFLQDADGSYYEYGHSNDNIDSWVTDPSIGYYLDTQSPMAVGQSNSGTVTYNDGTVYTYAYMVTGIEIVATPLGYFEAYRVSENVTFTYTNGDSVTENNVEWYVPAIGSSIKSTTDSKYYTGGVFTQSVNLVAVITGTNVPH